MFKLHIPHSHDDQSHTGLPGVTESACQLMPEEVDVEQRLFSPSRIPGAKNA